MRRHGNETGIIEARAALRVSQRRRPEVDALVKELKERRMENKFAESMRLAFEAHPREEDGEVG
jgi:hypothetical protein